MSWKLYVLFTLTMVACSFDTWIYTPRELSNDLNTHLIQAKLAPIGAIPRERSILTQIFYSNPPNACQSLSPLKKHALFGSAVLLNLEGCSLETKINNAVSAGAGAVILVDPELQQIESQFDPKYYENRNQFNIPVILLNSRHSSVIESYVNSTDPLKNNVVFEFNYFLNRVATYEFFLYPGDENSFKFAAQIHEALIKSDIANYLEVEPVFNVRIAEKCATGEARCNKNYCLLDKYCLLPTGTEQSTRAVGSAIIKHEIYLKCVWQLNKESFWEFLQSYNAHCAGKADFNETCIDKPLSDISPAFQKAIHQCYDESFISKDLGYAQKHDNIILQGESGKQLPYKEPVLYSDHSLVKLKDITDSDRTLKDWVCRDLDRYYFLVPECHPAERTFTILQLFGVAIAIPLFVVLAFIFIYMRRRMIQRKLAMLMELQNGNYSKVKSPNLTPEPPVIMVEPQPLNRNQTRSV